MLVPGGSCPRRGVACLRACVRAWLLPGPRSQERDAPSAWFLVATLVGTATMSFSLPSFISWPMRSTAKAAVLPVPRPGKGAGTNSTVGEHHARLPQKNAGAGAPIFMPDLTYSTAFHAACFLSSSCGPAAPCGRRVRTQRQTDDGVEGHPQEACPHDPLSSAAHAPAAPGQPAWRQAVPGGADQALLRRQLRSPPPERGPGMGSREKRKGKRARVQARVRRCSLPACLPPGGGPSALRWRTTHLGGRSRHNDGGGDARHAARGTAGDQGRRGDAGAGGQAPAVCAGGGGAGGCEGHPPRRAVQGTTGDDSVATIIVSSCPPADRCAGG